MSLRWLLPLGFLGLISIAILLIIYILKPQYKGKRISGTLIWKRVVSHSKKYDFALTNLLIFFIQALVLGLITVGLAEPRLFTQTTIAEDSEYLIILDSSASMRAKSLQNGETRFNRAVLEVKEKIDSLFLQSENGKVSLIIADDDPEYLFIDLKQDSKDEIFNKLNNLSCSLKESDIESALKLAENRLESNPYLKILLYSDVSFGSLGTAVDVINIADKVNEQNIAILGCDVGRQDNEFVFELVLGAYGDITRKCNVSFDIMGADNGNNKRDLHLDIPVTFTVDEKNPSLEQVQRVMVVATNPDFGGQVDWLYDSYDEVRVSIDGLNDSIVDDDSFIIYGGVRDRIKVEYWSADSNSFWQFGFNNLSNNMRDYRDISFHEIYQEQGEFAENSGFDFYIFEHSIPQEILKNGFPQDGIVLLIDPDESINQTNLGLKVGEKVNLGELAGCNSALDHPLLNYIDPAGIRLTQYTRISVSEQSQFKTLLTINGDPILLLKDIPSSKYVIMPFSINMSEFYMEEFQIFIYNLVNHFMPVTLQDYEFNLGEKVQFNCKGESIEVKYNEKTENFTQFPAEFNFDEMGIYTFTTKFGLDKDNEVRRVYVHISTSESELFSQSDFDIKLNNRELIQESGKDFFIWLAVVALILLIIEWYIQFKYIL